MYTIYLITNRANWKRYVGQTSKSPTVRFRNHIANAKAGRAYLISKAIRKYGEASFVFHVIETCATKARANDLEQRWIRLCASRNRECGYNLTDGGEGSVGYVHLDETREKLRRRAFSAETRARMSSSAKARCTDEWRQQQASRLTGHQVSDETRVKLRESHLGLKRTDEQRANMSTAQLAAKTKKTPDQLSAAARLNQAHRTPEQRSEWAYARAAAKTPEQRSEIGRMGAAARNAKMTPEQRVECARKANAASARVWNGRKHTDEARAKMSATKRTRRALKESGK